MPQNKDPNFLIVKADEDIKQEACDLFVLHKALTLSARGRHIPKAIDIACAVRHDAGTPIKHEVEMRMLDFNKDGKLFNISELIIHLRA